MDFDFLTKLDNDKRARREKAALLWCPEVVHLIKAISIATAKKEIFQRDVDFMVFGLCFFLC